MHVAVIGAGSWGTALSQVLATNGHDVCLWAHSQETSDAINATHKNPRYLVDSLLSERITSTSDMQQCLEGAEAAVVVTPSSTLRETALRMAPYCTNDLPVVTCSKGVEAQSGDLPIDIFEQELGNLARLAVLSGPNHAEEVVKGMPSATVIASSSTSTACFFQELFANPEFRVYTSTDYIGVEICAAAKNVIAIATGISYGLGYGDNTAAALMTRGLAEMSRLVQACGGQALTCMGLAGMGDLVVTCSSKHSRNRRLGELIAQDKTLDDFVAETHMVAEGAYACKTLAPLADEHDVELPIANLVRNVLWEGGSISTLERELRERPMGSEFAK